MAEAKPPRTPRPALWVQYPLFYGCWTIPGAPALWDANRRIVPHAEAGLSERVIANLDGGFAPNSQHTDAGIVFPPPELQPQFTARWWFDGETPGERRTIISFWDRTVNPRFGSSSTFIAFGLLRYEQLVPFFSERFASIWETRYRDRLITVQT